MAKRNPVLDFAQLVKDEEEKPFLARVKRTARRFGWLTYHTLNSKGSDPGFPDLVLLRTPRLVFCELKSDTGRATKEQMAWMQALRSIDTGYSPQHLTTVEVYLWRPRHWDDILEVLR